MSENVVRLLARRVRDYLLSLRPPSRIREGVAKGLRFDPGPSNPDYATGENEPFVQRAFATYLSQGDVLYDIGANVGFFSLIGAHLVGPSGAVLAFEPVPSNAEFVRRNAALNRIDQIKVHERAVDEHSGTAELLVTHYSGGSVLASGDHRAPDVKGSLTVATVSVDDLVFTENHLRPDVVKIDVEGAELNVLKGMHRTLTEVRPIVIFEIDDNDAIAFERKQRACDAFLEERDYHLERLENSYPGSSWIVRHTVARPL